MMRLYAAVDIHALEKAGLLSALAHPSGHLGTPLHSTDAEYICGLVETSDSVRLHGYISDSLLQTISSALGTAVQLEFVASPAETYNHALSLAPKARHLAFTRLELSDLARPSSSHLESVRIRECHCTAQTALPLAATALELVVPYDMNLLTSLASLFRNIFVYGRSTSADLNLSALPYGPSKCGFFGNGLSLTLDDIDHILSHHLSCATLTQCDVTHEGLITGFSGVNLQSLDLRDSRIKSTDLTCILACIQNIEDATLPITTISRSVLLELARFEKLKVLDMSSSKYSGGNLDIALKSVQEVLVSGKQLRYGSQLRCHFPNAQLSIAG